MTKVFLSLLLLMSLAPIASAQQRSCSVPLEQEIFYKPGQQRPSLQSCLLLNATETRGGIAVDIRRPADAISAFEGLERFEFWQAKDGLHNWQRSPHTVYSSLLKTSDAFLAATSEKRVLYHFLEDVRLYLRSEDHGRTWIMPKYIVEGQNLDTLAKKISMRDSFRAEFTILAIHPANVLKLFASIRIGSWVATPALQERSELGFDPDLGIYVSSDGGETWKKFTDALRSDTPIGISPSNPSLMFAHSKKGVVRSLDGGASWHPVGQQELLERRPLTLADRDKATRALKSTYGLRIFQILLTNAATAVFLVTNKGVLRSFDGGDHWCLLPIGLEAVDAVTSVGIAGEAIFAGTVSGLYVSTDNGCSFRPVALPNTSF